MGTKRKAKPMGIEKTLVMIKPEGLEHKDFIHHRLSQHGLTIVERKMVTLNEVMITGIYDLSSPVLAKATMEHLNDKLVEVLLIQGENCIKTVINEVGDHKNPEECDIHSIRWILANKTPSEDVVKQLTARLVYYHNFVHRSNGQVEVEAQAKLFGIKLK
jgi:nucleoside diphosphate kinase